MSLNQLSVMSKSTQTARSHKTPREAARPERHQCLGVHNNATRAVSQPFVSATLALRELLSISWRESGSPAAHPSRVLSPVDGPLPRLFPCLPVRLFACLPLSLAGCCLSALVISPCLLQLPSAQAYITGDTGGQFFPLCSGTTGIGCDDRRPVICSCGFSLSPILLHKSLMFDLLRVMCEVNLDLRLPELI